MLKFFLPMLLMVQLSATPVPNLKVGAPFPNFELIDVSTGRSVKTRSHLGKKTILHVFASW
jgi:hypothetical protein